MKSLLLLPFLFLLSCSTPPTPEQQAAIGSAVAAAGVVGGQIIMTIPQNQITPDQQKAIASSVQLATSAGAKVISKWPTNAKAKPVVVAPPTPTPAPKP